MSRLDQLYRRLLLTKFFTKGWGKPDNLKRIFDFRKIISSRELCKHLVPKDYPIHIDKEYPDGDCRIVEGHFVSPFTQQLPGIMPKEAETAYFQMILPKQWKHKHKPVCIHLAGTGDHFFWRRRLLMAKPLLKEYGIASILLENPYYGLRKPKGQLRSSLHNVSDLFVMGGALILESMALLHWCRKQGYGPLGLTGISMGGHMASLAATNWPEPLSLIPCLSWSTASVVFTQGVMSGAIPWQTLETQFFENSVYHEELSKLIVSPEDYDGDRAYMMGQQFVKDFSQNFDKLQEMQEHVEDSSAQHEADQTVADTAHSEPSVIAENVQTEGAVSMVQASVGPIPHSGGPRSPPSPEEPPSSPSPSPARSRDPLTLQHALSKAKLSRSAPSSQQRSETLQHAVSKSKVSRSTASDMSQSLQKEAMNFMVGVMDECTHLANFSIPVDPRLIIIVAAQEDAYIPRKGVIPLDELWPGSEVRCLPNRGHIAAFLLNNDVFRKAIADSFQKQMKLYPPS